MEYSSLLLYMLRKHDKILQNALEHRQAGS